MMRLERFDSGSWRYQTCNACNACNVNDGFDCAGSWLRAYWEKVLNSLPTAYTHIPPSGVCLQFVDNRWHLDNQLRQLSFGCQTTRPFWLSIKTCICASCVKYLSDPSGTDLSLVFSPSPSSRPVSNYYYKCLIYHIQASGSPQPIHFLKAHDVSSPNTDENTNTKTKTVTKTMTKTKTPREWLKQ